MVELENVTVKPTAAAAKQPLARGGVDIVKNIYPNTKYSPSAS